MRTPQHTSNTVIPSIVNVSGRQPVRVQAGRGLSATTQPQAKNVAAIRNPFARQRN